MKDEINSLKKNDNSNILSKNKIKKYITVQRIKSKSKKLSIFSENGLNNIYTPQINQNNKNLNRTKNTIPNFTNALKQNKSIKHKINPLLISPNELYNHRPTMNSKNQLNKKSLTINHTTSHFSPKIKPKIKIHKNINSSIKSKSKIKKDKILRTFHSNNNLNHSKTIINNYNTKNNNKILLQKITKDTIFQKENINPNCYNTIATNINQEFIKAKKININFSKIKRNKNLEKNTTKANTNESLNTIIIKKNNSALLTFGNNDSLTDSFSKGNNLNNNYLLSLKQENETLKNELMKTKEKVDVLENKIQNLIQGNEANLNKDNEINFNYTNKNNNKKGSNKCTLKSSKSQKNFKVINRNKKFNDKKYINSSKNKIINNTTSNWFRIKK